MHGEEPFSAHFGDGPLPADAGTRDTHIPTSTQYQVRVLAYRVLAHVAYLPWDQVVLTVRQWMVLYPLLNWWGKGYLREREKRTPRSVQLFLTRENNFSVGPSPRSGVGVDDPGTKTASCYVYFFSQHISLLEWKDGVAAGGRPVREMRDRSSLPVHVELCFAWAHWILMQAWCHQGQGTWDDWQTSNPWKREIIQAINGLFECSGPGEQAWQYLSVVLGRRILPEWLNEHVPEPRMSLHSYILNALEEDEPGRRLLPRLQPRWSQGAEGHDSAGPFCHPLPLCMYRGANFLLARWRYLSDWWFARGEHLSNQNRDPFLRGYRQVLSTPMPDSQIDPLVAQSASRLLEALTVNYPPGTRNSIFVFCELSFPGASGKPKD